MYEFRGFYIPERMEAGIERWVKYGIVPGSFLWAVITNDLRGACDYADDENLRNIQAYVAYFYNEAPSQCWGSVERAKAWAESKSAERAIAISTGKL